MKAISLVDTTVFTNILQVPGKCSDYEEIMMELEIKIKENDESLFLPMVTIYETGNHIGQISDGNQRRICANKYVDQVQQALDGISPFTLLHIPDFDHIRQLLTEFPDWASGNSGIGDLSIVHDYRRLCTQHKGRSISIWSLDQHLKGYSREPELR